MTEYTRSIFIDVLNYKKIAISNKIMKNIGNIGPIFQNIGGNIGNIGKIGIIGNIGELGTLMSCSVFKKSTRA